MSEGQALLDAYLNGQTLDAQERAALSAWVCASPDNAKRAAELTHQDATLGSMLRSQSLNSLVASTAPHGQDDQPDPSASSVLDAEVLATLQEIEASADDAVTRDIADIIAESRKRSTDQHRPKLERPVSLGDIGYLASHGLHRVVFSKPATIAAIAAVLLLGVLLIVRSDPAPQPAPEPTAAPVIATLHRSVDAVWSQQQAPTDGQTMRAGSYTLLQGTAEIQYASGARVRLEAPADISLDSKNQIILHRGKLVGQCHTPTSKGFVVLTRNTRIVDLGTEFGVEVDRRGDTGVFVFDGVVELSFPKDSVQSAGRTQLRAGQGQRIDDSGDTTAIQAADAAHIFAKLTNTNERYEAMVLRDKPLVYYRLDQAIGDIARNRVADRYHAQIKGNVNAVREGGRTAFSFDAMGDFLQTTEPIAELRGAESYTIECWVKPRRYDFGSICSMNLSNVDTRSAFPSVARLELIPPRGHPGPANRIRFVHLTRFDPTLATVAEEDMTNAYATNTFKLDQWVHVAAVKSNENMTLYIDGQIASTAKDASPLQDHDIALAIGRFFTDATDVPVHARQFLGQLDEFAVYDHALSQDAIQARFELGQQLEAGP